NKPGVAGAFADAAIDDGVGLRAYAATLQVNLLQLRGRFERTVVIHCCFPGHTLRPWNVTTAQDAFLWIFRHVRDLALVFTGRTDIDQWLLRLALRQRLIRESSYLLVVASRWYRIICARILRNLTRHLAPFRFPLVAAAVENFHLVVSEQSERPQCVAGPPI